MHPITYSIIINLAILIVVSFLSLAFSQPLLFVVGLMMMNHIMGRFNTSAEQDQDDEEAQAMGFTADLGKK